MSDKQTAILDATLSLIAERGFHDTPMSLIAKEAGVSAGIIYHYFENKEALIQALYRTIKIEFAGVLTEAISPDKPMREQFRAMMRNMLLYFIRNPKSAAFLQQFTNSPLCMPHLESEFAEYYAPLYEALAQAQREQIIKALPEQVFYAFSIDVATTLAQRHAAGVITLDDDLIEQVLDVCWDALRL